MAKINTSGTPYIKVSQPDFIQMHCISDEQLDQLEDYSDVGFQGNLMWVSYGAAVGALSGAVVFVCQYFYGTEVDLVDKAAGLVETVICAVGVGVGLALLVPYRSRKRLLRKTINKIRSQVSA